MRVESAHAIRIVRPNFRDEGVRVALYLQLFNDWCIPCPPSYLKEQS